MVVVPETTSKEWLFWLQTLLDADKAYQVIGRQCPDYIDS